MQVNEFYINPWRHST